MLERDCHPAGWVGGAHKGLRLGNEGTQTQRPGPGGGWPLLRVQIRETQGWGETGTPRNEKGSHTEA